MHWVTYLSLVGALSSAYETMQKVSKSANIQQNLTLGACQKQKWRIDNACQITPLQK